MAGVLTSTRFKFFDGAASGGKGLLPAHRSICRDVEGPRHLLAHYTRNPLLVDSGEMVDFLVALAKNSHVIDRHKSILLLPTFPSEIELGNLNAAGVTSCDAPSSDGAEAAEVPSQQN